ncbi:MAG: DNA topoisomerase IB [Bacteroidota bacterium]
MYYRKRHGKGFTYQDETGNTIRDQKLRARFEELVIPPAWQEVEIAENVSSKILVTGRDTKGRKQYIYHPKYIQKRQRAKYDRILRFAEQLETMRRVTGQHLRHEEVTRGKVLACMVRLLDSAYFRPGSPRYTEENETYGLTTLRSRHLTIEEDELIFEYVGKSGKEQERHVEDRRLAKVIQELDDIPGYRIFKYFDESGDKQTVESHDLNEYIKEVMGEDFSAKDFRTWAGTMIAAIALDELGICEPEAQEAMNKRIREAVNRVAEHLGNTPAVARNSYIDPRIIEHYMNGRTTRYFKQQVKKMLKNKQNLSEEELSVLCLLRDSLND